MLYEEQILPCSGQEKLGSLLFIHGLGGSYRDNSSAGALSKYFDYYAINLPGHGEADIPRFDASLEEYAYYTAEYIKERNLQNLILMGHSLGGGVVCIAENLVRNHLAGLILVNPIARSICGVPGLKKILFPTVLEEVFELCRFAYYDFDRMKRAEGFRQACEASLAVQLRKEPYLLGLYDAASSEETIALVEAAQRRLETKTLYMFGRHDRMVPMSENVQPPNPRIEFCVFEYSGHCPHNEEPQRFVEQIRGFAETSRK
ncbi:MAG: alpha/beta hydrolase [Spirochaetaceae bacterium]|jgi:pimeloyl-ACP methyl ester carboxylesterase|nr:alpha/beta hydrolase [Spirochaetaceae bacterium]